jgi:hypothetical protein
MNRTCTSPARSLQATSAKPARRPTLQERPSRCGSRPYKKPHLTTAQQIDLLHVGGPDVADPLLTEAALSSIGYYPS